MRAETFHRLHELRMANDEAGYAMADMRPRFERLAGRHENGSAPRAVVAYQLFQTPTEIALRLAELLDLKPGARVLEPSAGLGRLLDAVAAFKPREIVAVECAHQCAAELFMQNRAGVVIKQRDFLTVTPDDIGQFDAVIMNPPFHRQADVSHIRHAVTFLRSGGALAALCLAGPARTQALKSLTDCWIEVPPGSFRAEGTRVATVMLRIRK
jgi:protein-L-isoaspartate O-methyltransferase